MDSEVATFVAVGTWKTNVHVYRLSDMTEVAREALGGEAIPRSVLMALFDGQPFLLCALGDGQLYNFHIDAATGGASGRGLRIDCCGTAKIGHGCFH